MIKPIIRFDENEKEPMYNITIKKVWEHYEGRVWNFLICKDTNKSRLLKDLNNRCKEQYLKIKGE